MVQSASRIAIIFGIDVYEIEFLDDVLKNDIPALPVTIKKRIQRAIRERLTADPIGLGRPLRFSLKGHRRLRVGNYRIIYRIEQSERIVLIVSIKHRKNAYEAMA
ncbi:type II toxin-antitoxin system RelE/ParE family toxin [Candidatus Babeliales bacterium]|nr:type II toxin-antitoxin system RelE/ParE family toxin [Candidatus Babeliales bacterium]